MGFLNAQFTIGSERLNHCGHRAGIVSAAVRKAPCCSYAYVPAKTIIYQDRLRDQHKDKFKLATKNGPRGCRFAQRDALKERGLVPLLIGASTSPEYAERCISSLKAAFPGEESEVRGFGT